MLIPKEEKFLYHTTCVFTSDYSVTLLKVAVTKKSLKPKVAKQIKQILETVYIL